jgi:anti-anti-sigma factor
MSTDQYLAEEQLDGNITKVTLRGRIDAVGASAIDLRMNLIAGKAKWVLLDLEQVTYISSLGLRSILVPARTISGKGGKLVLFRPSSSVAEVFEISGIHSIIPIHRDLDAALAEFGTVS